MYIIPLVSIIIPVYNGSNFLKRAIDSALAQTYPNIEILVIDDGSNDQGKTQEIALSYGDNIRYIEKENGGVATALNRGIEDMKGEYFSWLSHDDEYYPNKVEDQIDFLSTFKNKQTIISSDIENIGVHSEHISFVHYSYAPNEILYRLFVQGVISGCTLLIPKECFEASGGFKKEFKTTQDYDLWFRMIRDGFSFHHLGKILVKSRVHAGQDSQKLIDLCRSERIDLEKRVFSWFTLKDLYTSYGKPILFWKFRILLQAKLLLPGIFYFITKVSKKLGLHGLLTITWRKYVQPMLMR